MNLLKILKWPFRKVKNFISNIIVKQHDKNNKYLQSELNPILELLKIHKEDFIFWFLYKHVVLKNNKNACFNYYFSDGKNSADNLLNLCKNVMKLESSEKIKLFEFASGYGCVTRHFDKDYFQITSCDIHPQAMDFLSKQFNVKIFLSTTNPKEFKTNELYDVVFALSFFSHMNNLVFGRWIKALYDCVNPGGYLVFTTHGKISNEKYINLDLKDGFGFRAESEQKDLPEDEYGTAVSEYCYVEKILLQYIERTPDIFYEAYWWGHQDLYIIKRL
jgi:SAM-dependent methyltransferase